MCVEKGGDRAAGGVAGYQEGAGAAGGVFFKQGAEAMGDGFNHFAGHGEETGVAQITGVVLGCSVSLDRGKVGKGSGLPKSFLEMRGKSSG